jgi:hypothetical protein
MPRYSPQHPASVVIDVSEFDPKRINDRRHVYGISPKVSEHQRRKALLHRIRGSLKLREQRRFRDMFQPERSAADPFEAGHYFKGAERLWSAKLDRFPPGRRMSKRDRADFGDVAERNPTDRARSRSVDSGRRVRIIESQGRAQPHFHKPTRLNDSKVQTRDSILDLLLRIAQGERYAWWPAKRNEEKPSHVGVLRCIHEVQLSGCVNRFNRVSRLPRQGRGRSRDHRVHAAASSDDRLRVFQVTNAQFDAQ